MNPTQYEHPTDQDPTLYGYPVKITLDVDRCKVDITHALKWDGKDITLDQQAISDAINESRIHSIPWRAA